MSAVVSVLMYPVLAQISRESKESLIAEVMMVREQREESQECKEGTVGKSDVLLR